MKKATALNWLVLSLALFAFQCSFGPSNDGTVSLKMELFDAPPPTDVDHVYLNVKEVRIHKAGEKWITVAEPDTIIDLLSLVNGVTTVLVDTDIEAGHYTQLRIVLNDSNTIVVNGTTFPLTIPSGEQTGVKLNIHFTFEPGDIVEMYVDFDVAKSIKFFPNQTSYKMKPTYKVFSKSIAGRISGQVNDKSGAPIKNALVEADNNTDISSALTGEDGGYTLIVPAGTYGISASADGFTTADVTYSDVAVGEGEEIDGYDFVLE